MNMQETLDMQQAYKHVDNSLPNLLCFKLLGSRLGSDAATATYLGKYQARPDINTCPPFTCNQKRQHLYRLQI